MADPKPGDRVRVTFEEPPVSLRRQLFDRLCELVDPADRDDLVSDVLAIMAGHLQQQSPLSPGIVAGEERDQREADGRA